MDGGRTDGELEINSASDSEAKSLLGKRRASVRGESRHGDQRAGLRAENRGREQRERETNGGGEGR